MARSLRDTILEAIRRYALLESGDTVLVGVSGGADSVALLVALRELGPSLDVAVRAAHVDHGLRGRESATDRAFVEGLAQSLDVTLHVEVVQVAPGNMEAEARRARYASLERAATALAATKIATAHTLDDQAETLLLRLVRGAGRRGLGGIRPRRGRIIRPMLLADRVQVRAFLVERHLRWRRDRSNFDLAHERARMRAGFLPALAREFNPRLARALARLADVLREEDVLLDRLASAACGGGRRLVVPVLRALDPPLARRALRAWWRQHGSGRRLDLVHVEALLALAGREAGGGRVDVPGGAVEREREILRFEPHAVDDADRGRPYTVALVPGASRELPGGWRIQVAATAAGPAVGRDEPAVPPSIGVDDLRCLADADRLPAPLVARNRRPGDRIRPLGLGGRTTVKRLFNSRGVPRALRADYPLVVAGDEVLWVPGCARSEVALVTPATRRTLVIDVVRPPHADAPPT